MNYIVESEGRQEQEMGRRKSVDKVSIRLAERTLMTYVEKFRPNATTLGTWSDGHYRNVPVFLARQWLVAIVHVIFKLHVSPRCHFAAKDDIRVCRVEKV